jgi:L-rhamnose mutarotase
MQKYLYIEEKNRSFRPISMCFCMNIDENRTFFRCVAMKNDVFLWHTSLSQTMPMKRFAFKMLLKPGCEKEYARRHAAIWPELVEMIKEAGVCNYSIYWDKDTNILFGYQECASDTNSQDTTDVDPITQKWWDMMADIMEVNPDNSPVSIPIEEVFHLD